MIIGGYKSGATHEPAAANEARARLATMPAANQDAEVAKLSVLLDGLGTGSGVQRLRGGIWTPGGDLLALTEEVEIANGDPEGWYDLWFPETYHWAPGAELAMGVHFGEASDVARWVQPEAGTGYTWSDTYTDGTSDAAGAVGSGHPLLLTATYSTPSALPPMDDLYHANLGFPSAQGKLGETQPTGEHHRMKAGWHGTFLDAEPQGASLAIVDSGSPLLDHLVGERVRISHHNRSVVAYVHRATELDSGDVDLSLSRRAFAALTLLSVEELDVRVEVLT